MAGARRNQVMIAVFLAALIAVACGAPPPAAKPVTTPAKPATTPAKPATPITTPAKPVTTPAKPATTSAKPATPAKPATTAPKPAAPRSLTCFQRTGSKQVQATKFVIKNKDTLVCAKFRFPCSPDDTACTKAEAAKKTVLWNYTILTKDTCNQLAAMGKQMPGTYMNVACCSTDLCNKADAKADPGVKVVPGVPSVDFA